MFRFIVVKKGTIILPIIVISQFCCTTLWFVGNGVINDLIENFNLNSNALGLLTSGVQFGFIIGTLTFAILTIADRFSPSKVFFTSALLGAFLNLGILWEGNNLISLLSIRFLTGFFLAGIYPVGIKIAVDYFESSTEKSLGFLVGALVLGTAFPHLLKDLSNFNEWKNVLITSSLLAGFGGFIMLLFVPDGPYRKLSQKVNILAFLNVFKYKKFRSAAFGYFGHMWELYAFWTFVPVILTNYTMQQQISFKIPFLSFLIIGIGSLACITSGYISKSFGVKRTAFGSLFLSCLCCLISPLLLTSDYETALIVFLLFWGMVAVADSPLLSTLVAQNAPLELKGTAITIVNCIGFSITIISIQILNSFSNFTNSSFMFMILAIGPILGLISLRNKKKIIS